MSRMRCTLGIALLLAGVALAEEPPPADADDRTATPAATAPATPGRAETRTSADERFVPSEDISEDLSVSFPSDI